MKLPVRPHVSLRHLSIGLTVVETRYTHSVTLSVGLRANLGPGATNERNVWNPGTIVFFGSGRDGYCSMRFLRRTWKPINGRHEALTETTRYVITPRHHLIAYGALR